MSKLQVHAPYDGQLIKELDITSEDQLEVMVNTAYDLYTNQSQWIKLSERITILEKTADIVEERAEQFAKEAAREGGKPLVDSRVELARAVQGIREAARSVGQLVGREIPMNLNAASANRFAVTRREPIGVVVAISAFNHPFNLIVHQVVPAFIVGCPVIVKPASSTPLSCINLLECLYEAGAPKEWIQMGILSNKLSEKLVTDTRTSFLTFIGSGKVGWYLRSMLAPGAHCALEHGGAAPVILDETANIDEALPLLAKGGFYHAGQVCVSVQRLFVHASKVKEVSRGLVKAAKSLVVGDPLDEKTEVGPLILEREVDRIEEWVKEAKESGGKILVGGKRIGTTCFEPTVILNPADDTSVSQKEIFGPVVCIYTYTSLEDAIKRANNVPFSFQASIFTEQIDTALSASQKLNASAVMINDHTAFRVDWMPFGGRKQSGMGVGGILPTMEEMTEEKLVVFKSKVL
ncbi:MAG: acyl-CoA reductase-like NAD-dependent aldehyde dehydrogenase [Candidatus Omnitrophota bacterium]|jgi:acyl-CoA reductase-like NAD-dependent aldehyde dehydrogenase